MDLALNNLQRLICHKTQPTNLHLLNVLFFNPYSFLRFISSSILFNVNSIIPNQLIKTPGRNFECQFIVKYWRKKTINRAQANF